LTDFILISVSFLYILVSFLHGSVVEFCITVAIKESVNIDWIRLTGCSLHYQRIEDEIVRGITTVSIPWWWKWKNESLGEATRQKALKRKLQILFAQVG
jgi:hypothetical protein